MRALAFYVARLRSSKLRADFHERIAGRIAGFVPRKWTVDVGCGPGLLGTRISRLLPQTRVVGVDVDPRMARIARQETQSDVVVAMSGSLPIRSRTIDVVVSSASLKDWGDRLGGLREIQRVLRNDGVGRVFEFVTTGPGSAPDGFRRRYGLVSDLLRRIAGYVIPFSVEDARVLAEQVGGHIRMEADLGVVELALGPR